MNQLVSIIVPVYNTEKYIKRCAESIIGQSYQNLEIIFVDDGSTDGSGALLDAYQEKDERVHVIHQENAGVSKSRNRALDLAKGDYIQFADSDDWLPYEATERLVGAMQQHQCDMVIAGFYRVSGDRMSLKKDIDEEKVMNRMEFAEHMIKEPADYYYGVLWNKLFKRSIIEKYMLRMDETINWCEDFLFNLEYIRYAERFLALQEPVYYYCKRKNSLVNQESGIAGTIKMKVTVFDYYNTFYKDIYGDNYEDVKNQVRFFLISSAKDGLVGPPVHTKKKQKTTGMAAIDKKTVKDADKVLKPKNAVKDTDKVLKSKKAGKRNKSVKLKDMKVRKHVVILNTEGKDELSGNFEENQDEYECKRVADNSDRRTVYY